MIDYFIGFWRDVFGTIIYGVLPIIGIAIVIFISLILMIFPLILVILGYSVFWLFLIIVTLPLGWHLTSKMDEYVEEVMN